MSNLQGKRILLGLTGSIAAYKAAELASQLTQMGALWMPSTPAASSSRRSSNP
jgi:phosphopantothenoylcysteine synthetase/decarboxylase